MFDYLKFNTIPNKIRSEFDIYCENNKHLDKKQLYNFKINPFIQKNPKNVEDKKREKRKNFRK